MVAGHVPEGDEAWGVFIIFLRVLEYICAPELRSESIGIMGDMINEFYTLKQRVLPGDLLPKDHYTLHYKSQMKMYGPLIHVWTMRLEARHSYFIDVFRTSKCFKNVCLTMAKRHQYMLATYSQGDNLFDESVEVKKGKLRRVDSLPAHLRALVAPVAIDGPVCIGKQLWVGNTL